MVVWMRSTSSCTRANRLGFGLLYLLTAVYLLVLIAARGIGFYLYALSKDGPIVSGLDDPITRLINFLHFSNSAWVHWYTVAFMLVCFLVCLFFRASLKTYLWHTFFYLTLPFPVLWGMDYLFYTLRDKGGTYSRAGLIITDNAVWSAWLFGLCLLVLVKILRKVGHARP